MWGVIPFCSWQGSFIPVSSVTCQGNLSGILFAFVTKFVFTPVTHWWQMSQWRKLILKEEITAISYNNKLCKKLIYFTNTFTIMKIMMSLWQFSWSAIPQVAHLFGPLTLTIPFHISDKVPDELVPGKLCKCNVKRKALSFCNFPLDRFWPRCGFPPDILITLMNKNWDPSKILTAVGYWSIMRICLKVQPCFIWGPQPTSVCGSDSGAFTSSSLRQML